jgi:hypothetical protein
MTESDLAELLSRLNRLVSQCADGSISFEQFAEEYGYPIGEYALDGHEASADELKLLAEWSAKIAPHIAITDQILNKLCAATDASNPMYEAQRRIGPDTATQQLKEIARAYAINETT